MLTANDLRSYILDGLPSDHVEVRGDDGQHFEAVIVSPQFTGKSMVQQHQLVYSALGETCVRKFTPYQYEPSRRTPG